MARTHPAALVSLACAGLALIAFAAVPVASSSAACDPCQPASDGIESRAGEADVALAGWHQAPTLRHGGWEMLFLAAGR